MPSLEKRVRRRRRHSGILPMLIVMLTLVAAALVFVLVSSDPFAPANEAKLPFVYPENPVFEAHAGATAAPILLGGEATAAPVQVIENVPVQQENVGIVENNGENNGEIVENDGGNVETVENTGETANRLVPQPLQGDYFLPVFDRALRTPNDEMMIAITVDDCEEPEQMTYIMNVARQYGAKLTLFPTGEALMTPGMTEGFRTCVRSLGFQLENHNYSHKAEYRISNSELAIQLWKQSIAADYAVGVDYEQHFYRPYNNLSVHDQRTHYYAGLLGYQGIAGYTHSYKDVETVEQLIDTLENGKIYQFDLTEESMNMIEPFMLAASNKGYKLVTMNKLFGLNEDVLGHALTIDQQTLITMENYTPTYYDLKLGYRVNAVYALQARLMELGYMASIDAEGNKVKADGIYGADTSIAVSQFQGRVGLVADGNATAETQERLFALNAPVAG